MISETQKFLIDKWGELYRKQKTDLVISIKEIIFGIGCPECKRKLHKTFVQTEKPEWVSPVPECIYTFNRNRHRKITKHIFWCECGFEYAHEKF